MYIIVIIHKKISIFYIMDWINSALVWLFNEHYFQAFGYLQKIRKSFSVGGIWL